MSTPPLTPAQVAALDQSIALFNATVDQLLNGLPDLVDRFGRERAVAVLFTGLTSEAPAKLASIAAIALVRLHEQRANEGGRSS